MRERQIRLEPFETLSVLDYEMIQEPNHHGKANITVQINADREAEYLSMAKGETNMWIKVSAECEEGERITLFYGILHRMMMHKQGSTTTMELELVTGTILLEGKAHFRTFQKDGTTYRELVDICNDEYDDAATIMTVGRERVLPRFVLQYKESDWTFLKRVCAMAGGMLMPANTVKGIKYFFGMPNSGESTELDTDSYTLLQGETTSYKVESRDICSIGESVRFLGKQLSIWKMESKMRGNELYHTYYLGNNIQKTGKEQEKYQEHMIGASLYGKVLAVDGEKVKIELAGDENKEKSGSRWFAFSTVYSSPDGAGWYCMPEIGDTVRLHIPSSNEAEAYVCSAVHENEGGGIRVNPQEKIWRNCHGKEIRLTPDRILMTNNKGTSIEISDSDGIHIKSSGAVNMKAQGRMQLSSENSGIELTASNRILIQQGQAEMVLQDGVRIRGAKVNIM